MTTTTEQKIVKYLQAESETFARKPRLSTKAVVEYANEKGCGWSVSEYSEYKERNLRSGVAWTRGSYSGYEVRKDGRQLFSSTRTYGSMYDLIRLLPNFEELKERAENELLALPEWKVSVSYKYRGGRRGDYDYYNADDEMEVRADNAEEAEDKAKERTERIKGSVIQWKVLSVVPA